MAVADADDAPTPEQLAAITAAVELLWPRPAVMTDAAPEPPRWRFSGRWWVRPVAARRDRPW
jgi:hypothetical protein